MVRHRLVWGIPEEWEAEALSHERLVADENEAKK
jgi:hypothetical protein